MNREQEILAPLAGFHAIRPRRWRGLAGVFGQGPFFSFLVVENEGEIHSVSFQTISCIWSNGIGMTVAALIEHRPFSACSSLQMSEICNRLPGIPNNKRPMVELAIQALNSLREEGVPNLPVKPVTDLPI